MKKIIGKITGIAGAACFVPLGIKYPLRKLKLNKANAFLMKWHEGASAGMFLFGLLHMAAQLVTGEGGALKKGTGIASLATATWLITDCHIAKDREKKMCRHRWYSLGLAALLTAHVAVSAAGKEDAAC